MTPLQTESIRKVLRKLEEAVDSSISQSKPQLVKQVITQIMSDVEDDNFAGVEHLLNFLSLDSLQEYLQGSYDI